MASKPDILKIASIVYLGAMVCWAVAMRRAEFLWPATLLLHMPQHVWLILPSLLLLIGFLRRNRGAVVWNLVTLAFVAIGLMGFRIPLGRVGIEPGIPVRVMTYNIHHGDAGLENVAATAKRLNPDIVCLQEANAADWKSELPLQANSYLRGWHIARFRELATLSKYPILSQHVQRMQPKTGRAVLVTAMNVEGRRLVVLNTHLSTATGGSLFHLKVSMAEYMRDTVSTRSFQIKALQKIGESSKGAVVIAGDFNTPPRGVLYNRMCGRFHDSFSVGGFGFGHTFIARLPVLRIDYVFVNDRFGVKRCFVPKASSSDHLPLVADLIILGSDGDMP